MMRCAFCVLCNHHNKSKHEKRAGTDGPALATEVLIYY